MGVFSSFSLLVRLCLLVAPFTSAANTTATKKAADCSCGFYDQSTGNLFTESTIAYFNETTGIPLNDFVPQVYEHKHEKGWNSLFRQGASLSNLQLRNDTSNPSFPSPSLEFFVDPATSNHLVVGSEIRTARQDMQYGSFRSYLRSPREWEHGSALSMLLTYNETQSITMDLMNTDQARTAWVSTLINNEFPHYDLGVTYYEAADNSTSPPTTPWDYMEYRVDWTREGVNFYIGGRLVRNLQRKNWAALPSTPTSLTFKHWSVGNFFSMQGPPVNRSAANVGWTRMFFNSSSTTEQSLTEFDSRCHVSKACSVNDMQLRGSSPYPLEATLVWKQTNRTWIRRAVPIWMSVACISLSSALLVNALWKRLPRITPKMRHGVARSTSMLFRSERPSANSSKSSLPAMMTAEEAAAWNMLPRHSTILGTEVLTQPSSIYAPSRNVSDPQLPVRVTAEEAAAYDIFGFNSGFSTPDGLTQPSSIYAPSGMLTSEDGTLLSPSATPFNRTRPSSVKTRKEDDDMEIREIRDSHVGTDFGSDATTLTPGHSAVGSRRTTITSGTFGRPKIGGVSTGKFYEEGIADEKGRAVVNVGKYRPHRKSEDVSGLFPPVINEIEEKGKDPFADGIGQAPNEVAARQEQKAPVVLFPEEHVAEAGRREAVPTGIMKVESLDTALAPTKQRVEHLAGLVAVSCLLVTAIHFCYTFAPATIDPYSQGHYRSETWARKTIDPYLLNIVWIGPFLMTSTRFLASSYLKNGTLLPVAEKTIGRTFRLMIPVTLMVLLEYFLKDIGATKWLEYLPSVTWSTWPFTVQFSSFGSFIDEIIQLAYLIPNAPPQIIFNYCTGVLWTIPVQLQGSWTTLIAAIMIYEIKTPWKRFGFYTFCIINHWYALSWGSYFYLGILLTDLDINFHYREYLLARPLAFYPVLFSFGALAIAGLTNDLVNQWTLINYASKEYGVHPDIPTGLPIGQTGAAGYPPYYVPKLNGLVFSFGLQAAIELSPFLQKCFSFRLLQYVFPHIFTIYLIHGFVFWSLGSLVCIFLATHGLPYWANLLVTAVCCYGALALGVPVLTPVVETVGRSLTRGIWAFASQMPAPRRRTLYPYPKDLLFLPREREREDEKKDKQDVERVGEK